MMEHLELSIGESEGITPVQLLDIAPAPSMDLPPVTQDMATANADDNYGQGHEEYTNLTVSH